MKTTQEMLIEFHRVFNHPIRPSPTTDVPEAEVRLRAALVVEEALEFVEALFDNDSTYAASMTSVAEKLYDIRVSLEKIIAGARVKVDLEQAADALADIAYVVEGSNLTFGIDGEGVLAVVHRANMAKAIRCERCAGVGEVPGDERGICSDCKGAGRTSKKNAEGKTVKPEGWKPPDIADELDAQAKEPEEYGVAAALADLKDGWRGGTF